jgi:hypothetical protein
MYNKQFDGDRNCAEDIVERLRMKIFDTTHTGLPDDDINLIQLLRDSRLWIIQAKLDYKIPGLWEIRSAEDLLD